MEYKSGGEKLLRLDNWCVQRGAQGAHMRDGLAITTQSVNRVTSFRTPRRTPKQKDGDFFSVFANGVSKGARKERIRATE